MSAADSMGRQWTFRAETEAGPGEGQTRLVLAGRIGASTAREFAAAVVAAATGTRQLLLDLTAVDYISSAGLLALEESAARAAAAGIEVCIDRVSDPVRVALKLAGAIPHVRWHA